MNEQKIIDKITELEERVKKLESLQMSNPSLHLHKTQQNDPLIKKIISEIDNLNTPELSLLSLSLQSKQTMTSIKNMLNEWGHVENTFFTKGKFKLRLVKKGWVQKVDTGYGNKDLFSLTAKGESRVKEIIKKLS